MDKLHFGCFDCPIEGWINTDITSHILISKIPFFPYLIHKVGKMSKERYLQHQSGIFKQVKYMDLTKRFPYGDNTLRCAFSSHVLEHLYFDQAKKCLAEVYRVLVPGGILRISVPDLDKYIREYDPASANAFALAIFQSLESIDKNRHHWMYNEASLRELLQDIGFAKVSRQAYKTGDCPDVEIIDNRADSLFMEAIK